MDISKQVCTLEQAKRLKELGVSQDSYFSWCGEEGQRLMDNGRDGLAIQQWVYVANTVPINNMQADHRDDVPSAKPFAAAYTVAELGEMLPDYLTVDSYRMHPHFYKQEQHKSSALWTSTYGKSEDKDVPDFDAKNEAQSRAAMLIHLIETKLVTIEEVNKRLQK